MLSKIKSLLAEHSRQLSVVAILLSLVTVATVGLNSGNGEPVASSRPASLPACEFEDGSTQQACFWDAQRQGNGKGWSLIQMDHGRQTVVVSWLPASCKAVSQLPGYELPGNKRNAIRGLVSGVEMIDMLREAKLSRGEMARECNAYLWQWAEDHPKAA